MGISEVFRTLICALGPVSNWYRARSSSGLLSRSSGSSLRTPENSTGHGRALASVWNSRPRSEQDSVILSNSH